MTSPVVREFMTASPITVDCEASVAHAKHIMQKRGVRHLPVTEAGRVVGIISQRDIMLFETLRGINPALEPVEEAMTPEPLKVSPDEPLYAVAEAMAANKYGSVVVVERGAVIGIFTTVDALRALNALLT